MSQIEAAVAVLAEAKRPMNCKALVETMQVEGKWASPGDAKTDVILYTSILREIKIKANDARLKKVDRGLFASNCKMKRKLLLEAWLQ